MTQRTTRWNLTPRMANLMIEHAGGPQPVRVGDSSYATTLALLSRGLVRATNGGRQTTLTAIGRECAAAVCASRAETLMPA